MIPEDKVLEYAASLFQSVWALELLLVFKSDPARAWQADELIRELRSSQVVVAEALSNLLAVGLAAKLETGSYQYHANTAEIDEMVTELQRIYHAKPAAVIREIVTPSNRKLKLLSDAFRFKE